MCVRISLSERLPRLCLCPLQVGTAVTCRILTVDTSARRARATLKRTIVESKLAVIASPADAAQGTVAHGVITGVQPYGCFVEFFGKVQGMAHKSHLGLLPDENPTECFQAGQVVKCTVIGPDSSGRGLRVTFAKGAAPEGAAAAEGAAEGSAAAEKRGKGSGKESLLSAGEVVEMATVKSVNEAAGVLEARPSSADHPAAASLTALPQSPRTPTRPLLSGRR